MKQREPQQVACCVGVRYHSPQRANFQGDFLAVQITSQSGYDLSMILEQDDLVMGDLPKTSFIRYDK